jgi:multidrug transporter EmrE-like cation transporter
VDWTRLIEVIIVVLFTSTGQLLLRVAMRDADLTEGGLGGLIAYALQTPALWLGIAAYGASTLLWLRVLSRYPVGAVYPMVAIGYILVTLGGVVFLQERVPAQTWIGLGVICAGVLIMATSQPVSS